MAEEFSLREADLREMLPSGVSTVLGSRVGWACTYLKKAGLLSSPKRSNLEVTGLGRKILEGNPKVLNTAFLAIS